MTSSMPECLIKGSLFKLGCAREKKKKFVWQNLQQIPGQNSTQGCKKLEAKSKAKMHSQYSWEECSSGVTVYHACDEKARLKCAVMYKALLPIHRMRERCCRTFVCVSSSRLPVDLLHHYCTEILVFEIS